MYGRSLEPRASGWVESASQASHVLDTHRLIRPITYAHFSYGIFRFVDIGMPCECAEEYLPGGFHPVSLGDTFKDGIYRIIRKLGYGSFSTVWLVKDAL